MTFPINSQTPVTHAHALPDETDVVVIGGGVIGVTTALYLARDGLRVTLLEKGRIAGEQSSRNWGWIRQQGRDPDELPIMVEARRLWKDLATETNVDFGLRESGVVYMARDAKAMERLSAWLPHGTAHDTGSRLLTALETRALFPGISAPLEGALYTPGDMKAEPWLAVPALAAIAQRAGAVIRENCAVRALDLQAGKVAGVVTEAGRIRAPQVVLAGGAWSALFLGNHGVQLPQLSVRATVVATHALPKVFDGGAALGPVAFRHRADGGYSLASGGAHELFLGPHVLRSGARFFNQFRADPFATGFRPAAPEGFPDAWGAPRRWQADAESPFEKMRILNPRPNARKARRVVAGFERLFPHLGKVAPKTVWAGMIDTMPDIVPVVDRLDDLPGLTLATGMSGHGFGIGPGIGRVVSALVQGKPAGHDLTRFRMRRFADGAPMELGPAL